MWPSEIIGVDELLLDEASGRADLALLAPVLKQEVLAGDE
jgi:hypothetical protein